MSKPKEEEEADDVAAAADKCASADTAGAADHSRPIHAPIAGAGGEGVTVERPRGTAAGNEAAAPAGAAAR